MRDKLVLGGKIICVLEYADDMALLSSSSEQELQARTNDIKGSINTFWSEKKDNRMRTER